MGVGSALARACAVAAAFALSFVLSFASANAETLTAPLPTSLSLTNINFPGNLVMGGSWSGLSAPRNSNIYWLGNMSGSCNNSPAGPCAALHLIANVSMSAGTGGPIEMIHAAAYLQAGHVGNLTVGEFTAVLNAPTANTGSSFYQGQNFAFIGLANDGGTSGSPRPGGYGAAGYCNLIAATFYYECSGLENGLSIDGMSSSAYQYGFKTTLTAGHVTAASVDSAAFSMGAQSGATPTLACGLCTGQNAANSPLAASADFIAHHGAGTAPSITNGIHMSNWTFSGNVFDWPNGTLDRFGNLTLDNGSLVLGSSSLIYMAGLLTPISSPSAALVQLGALDAASPVAQALGVQNVASGNANTAAASWTIRGSLSNGSGAGGDVHLQTTNSSAGSGVQNTASDVVVLKGGSHQVQFGSASFTANGSVATAMSSLGPAGSHATIQEWLTVQDAGGTVRYIPAF